MGQSAAWFARSHSWQLLGALLVVLLLFATPVGRDFLTSSDHALKLLQAVAWPAVVALSIVMLLTTAGGRRIVASLPGRVSKVSAFGVELALTPDAAKEVHQGAEQYLGDYRQRINVEFDRQVATKRINELRIEVVEDAISHAVDQGWMLETAHKKYRSTVHVLDVLYHDVLFQLLDYYPEGGGRSRTWSIRRGILGVAWRLHNDQIEGHVSTDPKELIKTWAMTMQEAAVAARGRQSFACVLLRDESALPVAVVYLDSPEPGAFPDPTKDRFADFIREKSRTTGLTVALASMQKEMMEIGPHLALFA